MNFLSLIPLILLFVVLAAANIFFRRKLLKSYKKLVKARVQFDFSHVWNKEKMAQEVYPHHSAAVRQDIDIFVSQIRQGAIFFVSILLILAIMGLVQLKYFA